MPWQHSTNNLNTFETSFLQWFVVMELISNIQDNSVVILVLQDDAFLSLNTVLICYLLIIGWLFLFRYFHIPLYYSVLCVTYHKVID